MRYELNGKEVRPPKGWIRLSNWKPAECVKECPACGQPYWRSINYGPQKWAESLGHRHCQPALLRMLNLERKTEQQRKPVKRSKSPEAMDREQSIINLRVDEIISERYHTPLSHQFAKKFMPQICWIWEGA